MVERNTTERTVGVRYEGTISSVACSDRKHTVRQPVATGFSCVGGATDEDDSVSVRRFLVSDISAATSICSMYCIKGTPSSVIAVDYCSKLIVACGHGGLLGGCAARSSKKGIPDGGSFRNLSHSPLLREVCTIHVVSALAKAPRMLILSHDGAWLDETSGLLL